MHVFVCLHARVREGVCLSPSVLPSVCLSACMFVRPNICSHMRAFINACATFLISNFSLRTSNFLFLTSMFVLGCLLRTNMCAYVYQSVRMYLSASGVRVSMLASVCVHARVREGVCVSPSVRSSVYLSVCPRACSCVQMLDRTCVRSSMHAFVYLHGNMCELDCTCFFVAVFFFMLELLYFGVGRRWKFCNKVNAINNIKLS